MTSVDDAAMTAEEFVTVHVKPDGPGRNHKPKGPPRTLKWGWADRIEIELDQSDIIAGLLGIGGITVLYGESGSGKTFFTIDLAANVAAHLPWFDRETVPGPVMYVGAEAPKTVAKRLKAWMIRHEVQHLDVAVVQSSVDLLNGDAEAVIELGRQLEAERGRLAMVVVDTLARAMTGNENAPDDMGPFVAACGKIREQLGAHVLIVHHSGKDQARGARGHSSLRATTDVEIEVTAGEGTHSAKVTKHRDEAGGQVFGFGLEQVELGMDSKGRTLTTCVAAESEVARLSSKSKRSLPPAAKIALAQLKDAIAEIGEVIPASSHTPSNKRGVTIEAWRQRCFLAGISNGERESARRMAFNRACERLVADDYAGMWGEWVWLA